MKKTRRIQTFEPEPDVAMMLDEAKRAGLPLKNVLNEAVRKSGKRVIRDLAKRVQDKLATALTFNAPGSSSPGLDLAA